LKTNTDKTSFFIFVVATLISFILGCGETDDRNVISVNYLPIEVGNSWTFINPKSPADTPDIFFISGKTKLDDGTTAFIANTQDVAQGYVSRVADDLVLFHQTLNDIVGELIYTTPLNVGTTWQAQAGEAQVVAIETVHTPAGTFLKCFRIHVQVLDENTKYAVWLAENVGPVKIVNIDTETQKIIDTRVLQRYNTK